MKENCDDRLFVGSGRTDVLEPLVVEGYKGHIPGTVYSENRLSWGGSPLGGVATGYVTFDTDGRLGKWQIFNNYPKPMQNDAVWLSVEIDGQRYISAYPKDGIGDASSVRYLGHYPVADVIMTFDAPLIVQVRAYGFFIPGDATASNTPAAVFEVRVTNTSSKTAKCAVTFGPEMMPAGRQKTFQHKEWNGVSVEHRWLDSTPAAGERYLQHSYALAGEDAMSSGSPEHAALRTASELGPNQTMRRKFVLAWYQPNLKDSTSKHERHTYSLRYEDARDVAIQTIANHEHWLKRIIAWQEVIYDRADYPDWLKEALVNGLYNVTKNSVWLAKEKPDHHFAENGAFIQNESFATCAITETVPCHWFGHWPILFFFPELEYTTLYLRRYFQLSDGQIPFVLGSPHGTRNPIYFCQHTSGAGEYAQTVYRYYLRTGDKRFLQEWYPSIRGAISFSEWLDYDHDGLVNEHPHQAPGEGFPANNPFDVWPWYGTCSYTAGKWLATLEMGIAAAEEVGDQESANHWRIILHQGRRSYEQKLWNGKYYKLYDDSANGRASETCLSAQLNGVFAARVLGLENPLPETQMQSSLDMTMKLNQEASPYGMMNGVTPEGKPDSWERHAQSCFTGPNFVCAMTYLYLGRKAEGLVIMQKIVDVLFRGPHAMPWGQPCAIDSQTGDTHHGHDYHDALALWATPLAMEGHDVRQGVVPGTLVYDMLQAANPR